MTNMDLYDDETSDNVFYNLYPWSKGELKVGDTFLTKEECVRAIKKFHMDNSVDFTMNTLIREGMSLNVVTFFASFDWLRLTEREVILGI